MAQDVLQLNSDVRRCIQDCLACHEICLQTTTYCLQMGGEHAQPGHIRLLLDCAEICQTCANFMLRGSDLHGWVCRVCADVCIRCAKECERFGEDDKMTACADICHRCAASCQKAESQLALV